jgi:CheY-like chemotaxis protein
MAEPETMSVVKSGKSLAGMRCLVLDDEFLIALDIQSILENEGAAAVTCVSSADDALKALRDGGHFDLAILDLKLGAAAVTSAPVAEALSRRKIPFIFLTGLRTGDKNLENFPNVVVVEKPYQVSSLLKALVAATKRT